MKIHFLETSYLGSWLLVGIGVLVFSFLMGLAWFIYTKEQMMIFYIVLGVSVLGMVVFSFIASSTLRVQIDDRGVEYKFFPFINTPVLIAWKDIKTAEVVTYNPVNDYGGWGFRHNKKGKAYNTQGDKGLRLVLQNDERVLFTIINVEKAEKALAELKKE